MGRECFSWESFVDQVRLSNIPEQLLVSLECSSESYLGLSFEDICRKPKWERIFIWHNFLIESFLCSHLKKDDKYRNKACLDVVSLYSLDDHGYGLFSPYPPHGPALMVISLCICFQAFNRYLSKSHKGTFLSIVEHYCDRISNDQQQSAWGDDKVSRLMWNHSIVGYAGLYFGGLLLDKEYDRDKYKKWYDLGKKQVLGFFLNGITSCGVNREGMSYSGMTLKAAMPCVLQELMLGKDLEPEIYERLSSYVEYFAYEVVPKGGMVWNYNDSYMDPRLAVNGLLMASFVSENKDLGAAIWHETVGKYGNKTFGSDQRLWRSSLFEACIFLNGNNEYSLSDIQLPCHKFFSEKGYLSMRSSWGKTAFAFTFSCGKGVERIHQQSDHNSFTLALEGEPVILDSGPSNMKAPDSPSQSLGHQSILIDSRGMALCGGKDSTSGEVQNFWKNGSYTFISGDAKKAYNKGMYNFVKKALRNVWVVEDDFPFLAINDKYAVGDNKVHDFQWILHVRNDLALYERVSSDKCNYKKFSLISNSALEKGAVLDIYFIGSKPESASIEDFRNPKAYDDELIVEHKVIKFNKQSVDGFFWVILVPGHERVELVESSFEDSEGGSHLNLTLSRGGVEKQYNFSTSEPCV